MEHNGINPARSVLVTGGAGFIGSNFVRGWVSTDGRTVVNLDALTYAGNLANLDDLKGSAQHVFVRGDIADRELLRGLFAKHQPEAVIHFAAESHVDRSILGPDAFIHTNVLGTFHLLDEAKRYWSELKGERRERFRFLHVSTDEVYGSLGPEDAAFTETTAYAPNSPYSASKASSDHLVRAYHHTYGFPTLTTNCSNNYGPYQFPEKLIPLMILHAIEGKPLPVYGDGMNVRDWLYVEDHCAGIRAVLAKGRVGETYNIGGKSEMPNLELVRTICDDLDELLPDSRHRPHRGLIEFVKDRPGHDRRYAIDTSKIEREIGWTPAETLETGLTKTIRWYLGNQAWCNSVRTGEYRAWMEKQYT